MKRFFRIAALAAVALIATAAARPNWNNTVTDTTEGWHVIGNPNAKLKLIEFVSYTCPHCGHFETEGADAMRVAYVAPGTMSIEVHHVIRDPVDLAVALATNCGPRNKFVLNHTTFLRSQSKWLEPLSNAGEATQARWYSGSQPDRMRAIASDIGLYDIMASRGYERRDVEACITDMAKIRQLVDRSNASNQKYDIQSTPSFVLNGKKLDDVHSWDTLKPALADALK